jgi:hypothetical protein
LYSTPSKLAHTVQPPHTLPAGPLTAAYTSRPVVVRSIGASKNVGGITLGAAAL